MDWTDTDAILEYYRGLAAEDSDYVGYSEQTLKTAVLRATSSISGRRVIEIGAGPNPVVPIALAKAGRDVTVVEISTDFCEKARVNVKRSGVDIPVICAPAHEIPLADGIGDVLIMTEVLEHIPHELELPTLQELRRVVASDGRLLISVPNDRSWYQRWNVWRNGGMEHEHAQHLRRYTFDRLEARLREAQFEVEHRLRVPATDRPFRETRAAWVIDRLAFRPEWSLKAAVVARPV